MRKLLLAAAALTLSSPVAFAQDANPVTLQSKVVVERQVVENGATKTVLADPKTVVPGDKVQFQISYRNGGAKVVEDFVVDNPLPKSIVYAGGSGEGLQVSIDGGKSFGSLASLTVAGADGKARAATDADVTNVRWTLASLAPGAAGTVMYRGIVK